MKYSSRGGRLAVALALGTFLGGVLSSAQAPPPPTPVAPGKESAAPVAPQKPADAQKPTFRVQVNFVTTDAIVRDNNGQFVANLTKNDFDVFEDGILQDVSSLQLIHGGRAFNLQSAPPPPAQEGIILPPMRPTNDAAGRIFLLVVDDLHLDFKSTPRIRQLFEKISKNLIHDGDMFGIVSTGPSSLAIDLTYDRLRLDEAIKKISGSALKPSDLIGQPEGQQGPSEVRYRAHVAFSTAYDIMQNLEKVTNRRKAVVFVSNGYDFDPFPNARMGVDLFGNRSKQDPINQGSTEDQYGNPFNRQGQQFADADLARELAELTRAANRANATIYTIDPRGLIAGADLDEQVDPVEWQAYVRKTQDSLRVLAEETGGLAVVNQNDLEKALKRIDAETSDYYVLGYYSKNPDPTRRTRLIEVKVKKPGIQVWSRRAYSLKPPPAPPSSK